MRRAGADAMDTEVAKVEITWINNRVERLNFRRPPEAAFLSANAKAAFELTCDLRTSGKRMEGLIGATGRFIFEVRRVNDLCEWSPTYYAFVYKNYTTIRQFLYGMVILLNVNLLMVTMGKGRGEFNENANGYNGIMTAVTGSGISTSAFISLVIALINFFGYATLIAFIGLTEIPMLIFLQDSRTRKMLKSPLVKPHMYRKPAVFAGWQAQMAGIVLFVTMHSLNYQTSVYDDDGQQTVRSAHQTNLYLLLIFGVGGLNLVTACRAYVHVPDTPRTRLAVLVYDCLTSGWVVANLGLMACAWNGFNHNVFYALMLLDIINISPLLGNLTQAFIVPAKKLAWVMYLLAISALLYAQFGLEFYEESEAAWTCHTAMSCFVMMFYKAVPTKKTPGFGTATNRGVGGEPAFMLRLAFDLAWFFWGFILSKVLTGLILSTFGALRKAAAARDAQLKNVCFVSGLARAAYGDLALERPAPTYDELVQTTQNHWEYVNMVLHLMKKNPSEYTGCETFVQACLDAGDLRWVPAKTSYAIQAAGKSYGGAAATAGSSAKDTKAARQVALLQGLRDQLQGVRALVGGAASACGRLEAVLGSGGGGGAKGEKGKGSGGEAGDVVGAVGGAVSGAVDGAVGGVGAVGGIKKLF